MLIQAYRLGEADANDFTRCTVIRLIGSGTVLKEHLGSPAARDGHAIGIALLVHSETPQRDRSNGSDRRAREGFADLLFTTLQSLGLPGDVRTLEYRLGTVSVSGSESNGSCARECTLRVRTGHGKESQYAITAAKTALTIQPYSGGLYHDRNYCRRTIVFRTETKLISVSTSVRDP
jgi:hypothetical protein